MRPSGRLGACRPQGGACSLFPGGPGHVASAPAVSSPEGRVTRLGACSLFPGGGSRSLGACSLFPGGGSRRLGACSLFPYTPGPADEIRSLTTRPQRGGAPAPLPAPLPAGAPAPRGCDQRPAPAPSPEVSVGAGAGINTLRFITSGPARAVSKNPRVTLREARDTTGGSCQATCASGAECPWARGYRMTRIPGGAECAKGPTANTGPARGAEWDSYGAPPARA